MKRWIWLVVMLMIAAPVVAQSGSRRPAIIPENAFQVVELRRLGNGLITDLEWAGEVLAVGTTAGLWLYQGDELQQTDASHRWGVASVALLGDRVASGGIEGNIYIWNTTSGSRLVDLPGHPDEVTALDWSPDGAEVASAGLDGTVRFWDIATARERSAIQLPGAETMAREDRAVHNLVYAPHGGQLAATYRGQVWIWDVQTQTSLEILNIVGTALAWSPDGGRLVIGTPEGTLQVWDGGQTHTIEAHTNPISSVAWSPDGTHLASMAGDGFVRIWDAASWEVMLTREHEAWIGGQIYWSGATLLQNDVQGNLYLWDATTGETLQSITELRHIDADAWTPDGARFAFAEDDHIYVMDSTSGKELHELSGHLGWIDALNYSPDGSVLVSAGLDAVVRLWEDGEQRFALRGHTEEVTSAVWSPDSTRLATASYDVTARIWDAASGEVLQTLNGHTAAVRAISWSPDAAHVATEGNDFRIGIWDVDTGELLRFLELDHMQGGVQSVAWSPDGRWLAAARDVDTLYIWEVETGRRLYTLEQVDVRTQAWSPDGRFLAVASNDWSVWVWDMELGRRVQRLEAHSAPVLAIVWSPDGRLLATAGEDRLVRLWSTLDGEIIRILRGHTEPIHHLWWLDQGALLVSKGEGTVRLWGIAWPDVCEARSEYNVNRRQEPDIDSSIVGRLSPDEPQPIVGQTTDADDFVWWRLEDGSWVRGDVVTAVGPCGALPTID